MIEAFMLTLILAFYLPNFSSHCSHSAVRSRASLHRTMHLEGFIKVNKTIQLLRRELLVQHPDVLRHCTLQVLHLLGKPYVNDLESTHLMIVQLDRGTSQVKYERWWRGDLDLAVASQNLPLQGGSALELPATPNRYRNRCLILWKNSLQEDVIRSFSVDDFIK